MTETIVYRVFDTHLNEYWTTPKGKTIWDKPGSAKNAWNVNAPPRSQNPDGYELRAFGYWYDKTFNEQSRYVIHRFKLTRVE